MNSRPRPLTRSELEEYARDFVAKVVAELQEHGELLTVTYLLTNDDYLLVPTFYRTALEKHVSTAAIEALIARLSPRAVFYITRGWVSDGEAAVGLEAFGEGHDLVAYSPGDALPPNGRDAFCVLARTALHALVAVTPYRIEGHPEGLIVRCGQTTMRSVSAPLS